MKQFKQILVGLILMVGLVLTYDLISLENNQLNVIQQNDSKSKSKDKSSSKLKDKKKKKTEGKTRTYTPPKKDK